MHVIGCEGCGDSERHTLATYIVSTQRTPIQERWVCGRHITWAVNDLATVFEFYTVSVRKNAWHKDVI